jgi:hypothetical protein
MFKNQENLMLINSPVIEALFIINVYLYGIVNDFRNMEYCDQ